MSLNNRICSLIVNWLFRSKMVVCALASWNPGWGAKTAEVCRSHPARLDHMGVVAHREPSYLTRAVRTLSVCKCLPFYSR